MAMRRECGSGNGLRARKGLVWLGVSGGLRFVVLLWMSGRTRMAETGRGRECREAGRWRKNANSGEGEVGEKLQCSARMGLKESLGLAGTRGFPDV